MLHITNGDSAVELIREAGIAGEILPWEDVLHEGPVPEGLALNALSEVRARYLAGCGWGDYSAIHEQFRRRDARLGASAGHEEVVLWFEHDLYDQLQILQILDLFHEHAVSPDRITLICIDRHPDVPDFHGLGMLEPRHVPELFEARRPVSRSQLELARRGWRAFRSQDPTSVEDFLNNGTHDLPFLHAALRRYLEEFPAIGSGLSRTQRTSLSQLVAQAKSPPELFGAVQDTEQARYLGDWVFWRYLLEMCTAPHPLMETVSGEPFRFPPRHPPDAAFRTQSLRLTPLGHEVLTGREDWLEFRSIDRWLGGVHLLPGKLWRWHPSRGRLEASVVG